MTVSPKTAVFWVAGDRMIVRPLSSNGTPVRLTRNGGWWQALSAYLFKHWAHFSAMHLEVAEATETFVPFYKITLYSPTQGRAQ